MATLSLDDEHLKESTTLKTFELEDPFHVIEKEVTSYLKDFYKTLFEQECPLFLHEENELHLSEVYTNLHIQCRGGNGHCEDITSVDGLTNIFKEQRPSSCLGTHQSKARTQTDVRKVYLEGPAGIGKSVCCKKLAYDWATGKLDRYTMVFLLQLRYIKGNIIDAIFDQILYDNINKSKEELQSYVCQYPDRVLLILDGLDEFSSDVKSISELLKSIQGHIAQKCSVLVTSRPLNQAPDLEHGDILCKIVGYTWEDSQNHVIKYFQDSPDIARQLLTKLEESKNIRYISLNPLNMMLICTIWRYDNSDVMFSGKTELYTDVVHCIVKRFCCEKDCEFDLDNPPIQQVLRSLGKLAWDGVRKGELQFRIDSMKKEFPNSEDMMSVGLLSTVLSPCSLARKCEYSEFLHVTIQEYMAAHFLWRELAAEMRDPSYTLRNDLKHMMTSPTLGGVHRFFKGIFRRNSDSVESKERLAVLFEAHLDAIRDSDDIEV
ncbi:NLR family CARD domain-containing protein 4-like [Branchiostoma floridae x Branchiostoma japonicum]